MKTIEVNLGARIDLKDALEIAAQKSLEIMERKGINSPQKVEQRSIFSDYNKKQLIGIEYKYSGNVSIIQYGMDLRKFLRWEE